MVVLLRPSEPPRARASAGGARRWGQVDGRLRPPRPGLVGRCRLGCWAARRPGAVALCGGARLTGVLGLVVHGHVDRSSRIAGGPPRPLATAVSVWLPLVDSIVCPTRPSTARSCPPLRCPCRRPRTAPGCPARSVRGLALEADHPADRGARSRCGHRHGRSLVHVDVFPTVTVTESRALLPAASRAMAVTVAAVRPPAVCSSSILYGATRVLGADVLVAVHELDATPMPRSSDALACTFDRAGQRGRRRAVHADRRRGRRPRAAGACRSRGAGAPPCRSFTNLATEGTPWSLSRNSM